MLAEYFRVVEFLTKVKDVGFSMVEDFFTDVVLCICVTWLWRRSPRRNCCLVRSLFLTKVKASSLCTPKLLVLC